MVKSCRSLIGQLAHICQLELFYSESRVLGTDARRDQRIQKFAPSIQTIIGVWYLMIFFETFFGRFVGHLTSEKTVVRNEQQRADSLHCWKHRKVLVYNEPPSIPLFGFAGWRQSSLFRAVARGPTGFVIECCHWHVGYQERLDHWTRWWTSQGEFVHSLEEYRFRMQKKIIDVPCALPHSSR